MGPKAPVGVLRRDDPKVVSTEDAAGRRTRYRDVVHPLLGRLRRPRIIGWCAIVVAAAVVEYLSSNHATNFLWTTAVLTVAWFFGVTFASRTAQTRKVREQVAAAEERAATEERARIAHELHDVIAHSVSAMVVQTAAAQDVVRSDPATAEAIRDRAWRRDHSGERDSCRLGIGAIPR